MKGHNILYISTAKNRDDKREWSGTVYHSLHALESVGFEVDYVNALDDIKQDLIDKIWVRYWCLIAEKLKRNVRFDESYYTMRMMRKKLSNIDYSKYDIIFVPTDMCIVSALPKNIKAKIVHLVDAPVQSLFEYYTEFSNLTWQNRMEASILTKKAFRRADLIIASSDWCRDESVKHCGISTAKVKVVEFGANMDLADIPGNAKAYDPSKPLKIYWSGVNWVRKGGDVAVETCRDLVSRGIKAELHITGMRKLPSEFADLPWIIKHGFYDKNNPEQYRQLIDIMKEMDIFLFPSRAECSSIALCEANGFGLPCFVYDTGGTANYVINGKNGYMLSLSANGKEFADRIEQSILNSELPQLSKGAIEHYNSNLNWNVWGEKVHEAITHRLCLH